MTDFFSQLNILKNTITFHVYHSTMWALIALKPHLYDSQIPSTYLLTQTVE